MRPIRYLNFASFWKHTACAASVVALAAPSPPSAFAGDIPTTPHPFAYGILIGSPVGG